MDRRDLKLPERQPFKIGDKVLIGTAQCVFKVVGFGLWDSLKDYVVNHIEFVRIEAPGFPGSVFYVHKQFLCISNSLTRRSKRRKKFVSTI